MGKHNITRANNNLKKITAADKSKLQESVKNLQIQTEAFLEDTTNKNGDINADSSLQSIMQKLQQVSNRKK